jgi:hypothetical protein
MDLHWKSNKVKKLVTLVLFFVSIMALTLARAQKQPVFNVNVSVSPELKQSFRKGGRMLLHLNRERVKEPRNASEITIGVTPQDWDPSFAS